MSQELQGKKILFLCTKFFNYHNEIIKKMIELGAEVDYYDERPSETVASKALLRINRRFVKFQIEAYYDKISKEIKDKKYDYVLVVKAEAMPEHFIEKLKNANPECKLVLMLWDSMANNTGILEKMKMFDDIYSFDKDDCLQYGLKFRPLFYTDDYLAIANEKHDSKYDLLFVGTVHSDRYRILKNIREQFEENGKNVYYYMYIPSKLMYYMKKIFMKDFRGSKISEFHFDSISHHEIAELLRKSKTVIDIEHPKQTGLTMRTFEMMGANKKFITTNQRVKEYDIYNPANVHVINRETAKVDMEFMNATQVALNQNIKEKYSVEYFILELLGLR